MLVHRLRYTRLETGHELHMVWRNMPINYVRRGNQRGEKYFKNYS